MLAIEIARFLLIRWQKPQISNYLFLMLNPDMGFGFDHLPIHMMVFPNAYCGFRRHLQPLWSWQLGPNLGHGHHQEEILIARRLSTDSRCLPSWRTVKCVNSKDMSANRFGGFTSSASDKPPLRQASRWGGANSENEGSFASSSFRGICCTMIHVWVSTEAGGIFPAQCTRSYPGVYTRS